jgi:hypothetical protein
MLDLICLLDLYANSNAVDARFDQDFFVVVPRNGQGIEKGFRGRCSLDFRDIVSLSSLGGEVGKRQSGS